MPHVHKVYIHILMFILTDPKYIFLLGKETAKSVIHKFYCNVRLYNTIDPIKLQYLAC